MMTVDMIKSTVSDYFKTQPVLKAWLFGSFSREVSKPKIVMWTFSFSMTEANGLAC
ncbi:MAG: hypothetical protein ACI37U_01090 [Bacteroides sp.]